MVTSIFRSNFSIRENPQDEFYEANLALCISFLLTLMLFWNSRVWKTADGAQLFMTTQRAALQLCMCFSLCPKKVEPAKEVKDGRFSFLECSPTGLDAQTSLR